MNEVVQRAGIVVDAKNIIVGDIVCRTQYIHGQYGQEVVFDLGMVTSVENSCEEALNGEVTIQFKNAWGEIETSEFDAWNRVTVRRKY